MKKSRPMLSKRSLDKYNRFTKQFNEQNLLEVHLRNAHILWSAFIQLFLIGNRKYENANDVTFLRA